MGLRENTERIGKSSHCLEYSVPCCQAFNACIQNLYPLLFLMVGVHLDIT